MYSHIELALKYVHYYLTSKNSKGHGMHSPFVFDFIKNVLNDKREYSAYGKIEHLRSELLKNEQVLIVDDFGAGSVTQAQKERSIKSIAKYAAKPAKYGQLFYRMVQYYQPQHILELGTSLGITTSYLAMAYPQGMVYTFEGAQAIAQVAGKNFETLAIANIKPVTGNFDRTLQPVLEQIKHVDFAFIDGNHRQEPTLRYFHEMLPFIHNDTILIFDDIHWSEGMEQAWEQIKEHNSVRCSIDLFFIGIVFFKKEFKAKQDFVIRF